jgi:hypothetical protein
MVSGSDVRRGQTDAAARAECRSRDRVVRPGPGLVAFVMLVSTLVFASWCGSAQAAPPKDSTSHDHWTSHYPSFLPKDTLDPDVDATLIGTEVKPALQIEGLAVEAETKAFHVKVTVNGPIVPGEGLPDQPAATTCTWTVTMKDATADVPVSLADFHSVDHLGSVFVMGLVPGEHPPPPVLHPGRTLTFQLRSYELVGEGMMQWAPDHKHVVADWDYEVEND